MDNLTPENDTRNLMDKYKGLPNEEVIARLDQKRTTLEVAIENIGHDFNIGTIVRNANAFNVAKVHILGKRKYNRRGAMVTDKYLHITHFENVADFVADAHARDMSVVAIDNNRPESRPLQSLKISLNRNSTSSNNDSISLNDCSTSLNNYSISLNPRSILVFGSESDGISQELLDLCDACYYIEQLGSTRSINVGCASAIALYEFTRRLGYFETGDTEDSSEEDNAKSKRNNNA